MKFLQLEILNLASLDKQGGEVINFEEGALGESTIFSIVGPTGSGKSTLLDAICLALYNRAPRYPRKKGDKNQNIEIFGAADASESNRLAPTDSRNILTRGKKEGYSKLTFLANNGSIYRAEWHVRFQRVRYENAKTALYKITRNGEEITEKTADWNELPNIIGLDYDQFLRTVLIAQGSFANFLTAKENERYELLEKLIGCEETYTNIATEIKKAKDQATDAYNQMAASVEAVKQNLLNDEELAQLKEEIDHYQQRHPGYDEYRYNVDELGHNPYELTSYLIAKLRTYTRENVQGELRALFEAQYKLTLTEEVEIRYREEERTDTWTDEDGNEHTDTYTVQVPYEYYILNVKLTNTPLSTIAENNLTPEQLEMYRVYLQTSGNKPLIFGGGSPDTSASEDLSGVDFVNGTRPGNTAIVDLAKRQVGNVGGYPYWSWYGFNSRVEWCACFVSWCYGQMGLSEPRFAACQSQGIPWFTSHGQWGARGYENIAPGDAIFFDWDLDGSADHVGLVIGRDESRVYTVEGNSGDACKIKSYPLDYACIKGYGLMNWN